MSDTNQHSERHFGMLRAILQDYQNVISGPDVQRGMDALDGLEEQLEAQRLALGAAKRMADASDDQVFQIADKDVPDNQTFWALRSHFRNRMAAIPGDSNPASSPESA